MSPNHTHDKLMAFGYEMLCADGAITSCGTMNLNSKQIAQKISNLNPGGNVYIINDDVDIDTYPPDDIIILDMTGRLEVYWHDCLLKLL